MVKQSKINHVEFMKFYDEGYKDTEIAKFMKKPHTTINYYRKNILKLPINLINITLNFSQHEILMGTLLGDTSILYTHSNCNYPKITFSHSIVQKEYFLKKYQEFGKLMNSYTEKEYNKEKVIKGKLIKSSIVLYGRSKNLLCLKNIREIFYPNGIKIIPINYLKNTFTDKSLAFLFMDDGCKNGKTINLNMQSYTLEDLTLFVNFLYDKFNLEFIIKKDKTLYLRHNSIQKFTNVVKPYIINSMKYKLGI